MPFLMLQTVNIRAEDLTFGTCMTEHVEINDEDALLKIKQMLPDFDS